MIKEIPANKLAAHFHDTYGNALENILIALKYGISVFDSSIGGLGGCPYAKKSVGNVCTENVVEVMEYLDIKTGIEIHKLKEIGQFYAKTFGRKVNYILD